MFGCLLSWFWSDLLCWMRLRLGAVRMGLIDIGRSGEWMEMFRVRQWTCLQYKERRYPDDLMNETHQRLGLEVVVLSDLPLSTDMFSLFDFVCHCLMQQPHCLRHKGRHLGHHVQKSYLTTLINIPTFNQATEVKSCPKLTRLPSVSKNKHN
jgi:hypothetical protein